MKLALFFLAFSATAAWSGPRSPFQRTGFKDSIIRLAWSRAMRSATIGRGSTPALKSKCQAVGIPIGGRQAMQVALHRNSTGRDRKISMPRTRSIQHRSVCTPRLETSSAIPIACCFQSADAEGRQQAHHSSRQDCLWRVQGHMHSGGGRTSDHHSARHRRVRDVDGRPCASSARRCAAGY